MAGGAIATGGGLGGRSNGFMAIFLTAFAAFAGFLFGYDTGTIK